MGSENIKRILHAKNSATKIAYFHNEIIKSLEKGEQVAIVNMPEFQSMGDSRITYRNIDDISSIQEENVVFVFEVYPINALLDSLGKLNCKELNVTVTDFSAEFRALFVKAGFETLYISDDYIANNPVYGSLEELNAVVLRTIN